MSDRPFRFRVWHRAKKQWVHGPGDEPNLLGETILLGEWCRVSIEELNDLEILQCVGLKDSKGIEIYEGDILSHCKGESILAVQYCEEYARFGGLIMLQHGEEVENDCFVWFDDYGMPDKCEVIGNIYDNPELLNEHDQKI